MIRGLIQMIRSWYQRDRIRISPSEGKWLTLAEGIRILIRDEIYLVIKRSSQSSDKMSLVDYDVTALRDESELIRIRVCFCHENQRIVSAKMFVPGGRATELFEDDLIIL